jgi:hypothetical protein
MLRKGIRLNSMTSKKCCDKCGKEVNLKRIHIVWFPEQHSFSWICGECNQKYLKEKVIKDEG